MENWIIRKIEKKITKQLVQLIRAVFDELNIPVRPMKMFI
jgi:hypothetical protein